MPNAVKGGSYLRIKRILGWLQDGRYPNCTTIAEDLDVSVKTAERDLNVLRDYWEMPIAYDEKRAPGSKSQCSLKSNSI